MLLKSITLCCFMLNVQSQDPYLSQHLNPNFLYFADNFPPVLPLSIPGPNNIDKDALRRVFQDEPQKKKSPTTTVKIEKSTELEFDSTDERVPNSDNQNVNSRQTSTIPSKETAQQLALEKQIASQSSSNRQTVPQISRDRPNAPQSAQSRPWEPPVRYDRPSIPEISLGRPTVAVPQTDIHRPTIQMITLGVPNSPQRAQDKPRVPQKTQERPSIPEISLNRPSVAVPQNELDRPTAPQIAPPPNASGFNTSTKSTGFNNLLYSVTNFGVNLLKNIDAVHSGNMVISPFSITSLLALLQQGAWGQTQEQITNALQMTSETTASAYAQVTRDVPNRNSRNILRVANNVFVGDDFAINQEFKKVAIRSFNSDITQLNYARPEEAARHINSWVASRTDNRIDKLIAPGALDHTTQLVLVNAIYFKGLWEVPFRVESTIPREFQLSNGKTKTAQFMRMRKMFRTGIDKTTNAQVIILPFENDEYHLMVILPSQLMDIRRTLSSLTDARLLSYLSFSALDTELEIPKFTVRADTDLKVLLNSMGVTNMFSHYAELNGIGSYRAFSPQISSAVHSAVLTIDEQGGSAAAATAFAAVALSYDDPAVIFKANRPFIAVLWDNKSSLPLFMAKIEDPQ